MTGPDSEENKNNMTHSKKLRFSISEDNRYLIQETHCQEPMVAIAMHEHLPERGGHITKVLSGALLIHDGKDWQITLVAGQTLDLMTEHLKHEILTTENETVFQNLMPLERFSEEDIESFMEINKEFNP